MSQTALKDRLGNVPLLSLLLMKLCSAGGSVVYAEWRWKSCPKERR